MKNCFRTFKLMLMITLCLFTFSACSDNRAAELYDTAQFEELQNNTEHARELYREIVSRYPDSEFAELSEKRLSEL